MTLCLLAGPSSPYANVSLSSKRCISAADQPNELLRNVGKLGTVQCLSIRLRGPRDFVLDEVVRNVNNVIRVLIILAETLSYRIVRIDDRATYSKRRW